MIRDPMFWLMSAPLAVIFALSILRIVHPFWADKGSRK